VKPQVASAADRALARIFELGGPTARRPISYGLVAALLAHVGIAAGLHWRGPRPGVDLVPIDAQELSVIEEEEEPPAVPPPPAPPPEPPKIARVVEDLVAPAPDPEASVEEPPSSEAAKAGEALVQEEEPSDEEDDPEEEEDTLVIGTSDHYAGGVTSTGGAAAAAVTGAVVDGGGVPGGHGQAVVASLQAKEQDLSRPAWLDGDTSWDCDFPGEADRDKIDSATVGLTVDVDASGKAIAVLIVEDPGHGFGRMAAACALKHPYTPALDAKGRPVAGKTRTFHVGFHR
jgi:protein TonB